MALVDVTPALSSADQSLLSQLRSATGNGTQTMLAQVTGDSEWTTDHQPDFLAVRSGPGVTAQFAGGGNVTSWTNAGDNTVITYFGAGDAPHAYKGVAITFGPNDSAADRENYKHMAMGFLFGHLDDHQLTDGSWNRSLVDTTL